jgi:protein TonB
MKDADSKVQFPQKFSQLLRNYEVEEKRKAEAVNWIKERNAQDSTFFVEYDTPPEPVGGFHAIQQNLVYPEQPRKAGIQGTVTVQAKIGEDGTVIDTKILMSLDEYCDQAAINSIKVVDWIPATKDGKPVSVWVSIPVRFKLK